MADIFYFSSPRKPSPLAKCRPTFRSRPKLARRRRAVGANMFTTQAACVARHPEPVFCPNADLPLSLPGAMLDRHPIPMNYDLHYDSIYDDDDDDNEGGVALTTNNHELLNHETHDFSMTDTHVHNTSDAYIASVDTSHLLERSELRLGALARHSTDHDLRRRDHPRPESREIWEEEDGRKLRLALEGDTPQFEMRHVATPRDAGLSSDMSGQSSTVTSHSHASHSTLSTVSTDSSQVTSAHPHPHNVSPSTQVPPARETHATTIQYSNNASLITSTHFDEDLMEIDDNSMAVDDSRRNYDVAEFMDNWRLRSMHDKRLPRFEPGLQPSIRIGRSDHHIPRRHVQPHEMDMQGLRWKLIGPSRKDASIARDMLHPSRSTSTYLTHSKPQSLAKEERHFSFRSFIPGRQAKFSHYQLRHVLTSCDRNNVFYSTGNEVKQASLACPSLDKTIMDLSSPANCAAGFRITCLSANKSSASSPSNNPQVLIAGGFYGEYAVLGLDGSSSTPAQGFVTHAYNGLVTHIHNYPGRRSGVTQAVFCSNDCKVRIMDVRRLQFTNTFSYENAVNCAATSSDGRLRVLVGDSHETLITDAERGTTLVTLKEHNDHAFACDWSPDGRYVATGAQDGTVLVWDARNWAQPLSRLESAMICARSLSFTNDGALVAAENDDVVRIYDSGTYNAWQEMRFFGSIAGLALLDGGAELAIANADKTVGGLLTFERSPQGRVKGSYGKRLDETGARGVHRWRHGSSTAASDLVDDLHF